METRQHGFTLWELMMAVVVAGIILGLAVPSFREFQRTNAMAAAANELVAGALLARSEAVKRQVPVTLCATQNPAASPPVCAGASAGAFIVFVDENGNGFATDATDGNAAVDTNEIVLLRRVAPGGEIRMWTDSEYVTYGPNGYPRRAVGHAESSATRLLFCDDRGTRPAAGGSPAARVIVIEPTGRGSVRSESAEVAAAVDALDAECGG